MTAPRQVPPLSVRMAKSPPALATVGQAVTSADRSRKIDVSVRLALGRLLPTARQGVQPNASQGIDLIPRDGR